MALYAFDGTWNEDEQLESQDTNVVRFTELYAGLDVEYLEGVGTRWGAVGKALGGLFGLGGRTRIDEMYDDLCENWQEGDKDIDIIGFSRGGALAVHFANKIADDGIKLKSGEKEEGKIRFLGVWDVVGSFGFALNNVMDFQEINLGWDIDNVAGVVETCCHAMALDERRESFGVTRLNPDGDKPGVTEVWFRGVHSDIGGGNSNESRSNIALNWMLDQAQEAGVPINGNKRLKERYALIDPMAKISENTDVKRDKRREVLDGDQYHPSARGKKLKVDEVHECNVLSELKYNWSGVSVERDGVYEFEIDDTQRWVDGNLPPCGPDGWKSDVLPWYKEGIIEKFEKYRRCSDANWFEVIGTLDDEDDDLIRLLKVDRYKAPRDAELYFFANDLASKYGNNSGSIRVKVHRVS